MLYVIAGPTASGKTAVALALARLVNGEVISADSMQVYKGMDIGTAKPTSAERAEIPHHLLDVVRPDEPFSVAQYQKLAQAAIADIAARGRTPILAGGTGFYINAVVYGTDFSREEAVDRNTAHIKTGPPSYDRCEAHIAEENILRNHYAALAAEKGAAYLHTLLTACDPEAAAAIHPNNIKRTARALAFCENTGLLFSEHNASRRKQRQQALPPYIRFFVLTLPRAQLYERINNRTRQMLDAGLVQETAALLAAGYPLDLPAMGAIGYKEVAAALANNPPVDFSPSPANNPPADFTPPHELKQAIAQATRRYAKRQITWFTNSSPHAQPIDASSTDAETIAKQILQA